MEISAKVPTFSCHLRWDPTRDCFACLGFLKSIRCEYRLGIWVCYSVTEGQLGSPLVKSSTAETPNLLSTVWRIGFHVLFFVLLSVLLMEMLTVWVGLRKSTSEDPVDMTILYKLFQISFLKCHSDSEICILKFYLRISVYIGLVTEVVPLTAETMLALFPRSHLLHVLDMPLILI